MAGNIFHFVRFASYINMRIADTDMGVTDGANNLCIGVCIIFNIMLIGHHASAIAMFTIVSGFCHFISIVAYKLAHNYDLLYLTLDTFLIRLIFPDLIDQRFQRVDGNLFVAVFHFIGAAAGAFPGEVFEPLGGQEGNDPA
jgi:hypothetical protein